MSLAVFTKYATTGFHNGFCSRSQPEAAMKPVVQLKAVLFNWNESDEMMDRFRKDARALGLKAAGGKGDCYYWVLDHYRGGPDRFARGTKEYENLVKKGEIIDMI